jgi:hypothetical protein
MYVYIWPICCNFCNFVCLPIDSTTLSHLHVDILFCVCVCPISQPRLVPRLSLCVCINMRPLPELTKDTKLRYPNAAITQPMLNVAAVLCCIRWARTVYTATAAALVSG